MLSAFINEVSKTAGITRAKAEAAIGIVLNAAERQGAPIAAEVFERHPGARPRAAPSGAQTGPPTGVRARRLQRSAGRRVAGGDGGGGGGRQRGGDGIGGEPSVLSL